MDDNPITYRTANRQGRGPWRSVALVMAFLTVAIASVGSALGQTQVIPLRSGSGPIGGPDANVRVLVDGTLADSVAVQTASFAVVSGSPDDSIAGLQIDPTARWIKPDLGQDGGQRTVLYAVPFTVNAGALASANLQYVARGDRPAEDQLGAELLLNGRPIGEIQAAADGTTDEWLVVEEIAPWLTPGVNWLYMSVPYADLDGGLIFSARVRIWRPSDTADPADDAFAEAAYGVAADAAVPETVAGCVGFTCRSRGDLDSDHDVDLDDYYRFRKCISGADTDLAEDCEYADFECDGDVDLADVASFQAAFDSPW